LARSRVAILRGQLILKMGLPDSSRLVGNPEVIDRDVTSAARRIFPHIKINGDPSESLILKARPHEYLLTKSRGAHSDTSLL